MVTTGGEQPPLTISQIINSPYNKDFSLPTAKTPKELANLMIAYQVKLFGKPVDLPYPAVVRNMKLLIKKHGLEMTQRGLMLAVHTAQHPFSSAYIEQMIEQLKGTR